MVVLEIVGGRLALGGLRHDGLEVSSNHRLLLLLLLLGPVVIGSITSKGCLLLLLVLVCGLLILTVVELWQTSRGRSSRSHSLVIGISLLLWLLLGRAPSATQLLLLLLLLLLGLLKEGVHLRGFGLHPSRLLLVVVRRAHLATTVWQLVGVVDGLLELRVQLLLISVPGHILLLPSCS